MAAPDPSSPPLPDDATGSFTVYWRPGCGFCSRLFRQFDRHGLDPVVVNIWEDDEARRFLNDAIGCETVPTVVVGDRLLVNPSVREVLAALSEA
jgi:glutaredoxin